MGGPYTVFKIVIISLVIILSGCLQNQQSVMIQDVCCQNITNGECIGLRNMSNNNPPSGITINDGGKCSDLSRLCYDVNISTSNLSGRVNIPYCKYANIDNCNTGFTMLVYDVYNSKQRVNYDFLIQKFMFNNTLPVDQGEELKQKTPFGLLYGTLSRKFVGKYDFDKFNIYGTKFGVGDSILEYEHYKYFYPFDRDYQGTEGFNPIFYNIDESSVRKCELNGSKYVCANKEYETWESCLLMCEMPNTGRESLSSFYDIKYRYNRSYGYEYLYSVFNDSKNVLKDEDFYKLLVHIASLDRIVERYPVGLFKTFAQPDHPNFFHKIFLNESSLTSGGGLMTGCFLGIGLGFGSKSTVTLNPGNYTVFVEKGDISRELVGVVEGKKIYRVNYNLTLKLPNLNLTKFTQSGFIFTSCSQSKITTDLYFNMALSEIFIEEEYPMAIMQDVAKKYYKRFGFSHYNTSRPLIQRFDRNTNKYYNFSGLPFECIYEDESGGSGTCSTEYYTRYSCINASNNQSLDCWCDTFSCYAYYHNYSGPMLNIKTGLESKPTLIYNLTNNIFESPEFIPKRTIKFDGKNAVVIPANDNLNFDEYRLKKACFSGNVDRILLCDADTGGQGCPEKDTELWNQTFKRYDFQFDDITYLKKVVVIIDENGDGNYGECKGKRVNKTVNGTTQEFLDLDIRIFGLPVPPNPSLSSITVKLSDLPNNIEYSGRDTDNIKVAKYACIKPDLNYGETKDYKTSNFFNTVGLKEKYDFASFAFDDFGRLIGCYQGAVAMNRSLDGEMLFIGKRAYEYGLYKHYPFTRSVADYLMKGKQIVMFVDNVNKDYLKKVLREVDVFVLANERIPRPFIKYSASPIGSVILVSNYDYDSLKSICPTCLVAKPRIMEVANNNINAPVPSYGTRTEDVSNKNLPLSCPNVSIVSTSTEDVLFYIVNVQSVSSNTINAFINKLSEIKKQSGGTPIYLYINGSSGAKQFVDLLVNHSHNLSSQGVMGVHIGNMNDFMMNEIAYSSSMELSRSISSSYARLPVLYQVENRSECTYIVDEQNSQPITCIPDPVPQVRSSNTFPTYNIVVDRTNFARYSLEIATSNYYNDKTICIKAPDGRLFTYKLTKQYIKGTNPVIYDEIGNRVFDFVEYKYNNKTNMLCLPAKCSYKLETFCQPSTCYMEKKITNLRGVTTERIAVYTFHEYGGGAEQCIHRNFTLTLRGFGSFYGRYEDPYIIQEACTASEGYRNINFNNNTAIVTLVNNCTPSGNGYYNILGLKANNTIEQIPINYTQEVYQVNCSGYTEGFLGHSSHCICDATPTPIQVNGIPTIANIKDDICVYSWGNIWPQVRYRSIGLPVIYDTLYNETYNANWCVQEYVLRCE